VAVLVEPGSIWGEQVRTFRGGCGVESHGAPGGHAGRAGEGSELAELVLFPGPRVSRAARSHRGAARGVRRLLPGAATLALLGLLAMGVGALSRAETTGAPAAVGGAQPTAGGYEYVVRPGDTLFSIAERFDPAGNPLVLVTALESELGGTTIVPGERIFVPVRGPAR
jgi:hypothetical protein